MVAEKSCNKSLIVTFFVRGISQTF
uniref:Uncharacterized protein n=1 Tax=Anguilla anguilla TaxID=7936 RepID=A0A0E9XMM0_ANGAN